MGATIRVVALSTQVWGHHSWTEEHWCHVFLASGFVQIFPIVLRPVSSPLLSLARTHHSKCSLKNKVRALWEQLDLVSGLLVPLIEVRCVIISPSLRASGCLWRRYITWLLLQHRIGGKENKGTWTTMVTSFNNKKEKTAARTEYGQLRSEPGLRS